MEIINMRNNKSITPFNGEKYNIWKARVRALIDESIMDQNALAIIDCENCPMEIEESDWQIWNKVAKGILIRSLGDSVVSYATNNPSLSARDIFIKLDSIYSRKSVATELAMEMKLQGLRYNETDSLASHFMTFDELVTDMESASGERLKESNKIARLLSTLPKSFGPLVIAMQTLNDKDLNLEFVKMRLLDYEVQLKKDSKDTSEKILCAVVENKNTNKTYNNKFSSRNNKYKRNFKPYNKNKFNNEKQCYHCGRKGHVKINCIYYKKQQMHQQRQQVNHKVAQAVTTQESSGFAFMMQASEIKDNTSFLLDSGASDHMINNSDMFTHSIILEPPIKIAVAKSGQYIYASRKGIVKLTTNYKQQITLEDVLFCKEVPQNLLSVKRMQDAGLTIIFKAGGVTVQKGNVLIFSGNFLQNVPIIHFKLCFNVSTMSIMRNEKYRLWHERLGHISIGKFYELKSKEMFDDVDMIRDVHPNNSICEACINGKQARLSFEKKKNKTHIKRALFIIHSDVCGPITPPTVDGKNYYVVFIDQFTHYAVTYLIKYKSEVFNVFKDFVAKCEAHFNLKIVHLYIDNGREYLSDDMKKYCIEKGISYHLTIPHTPQQNGVAERMIRTITEKARSMLNGRKMDKSFWGEAVLTATFIINRTPSNSLQPFNKTPYEMWHNKKPQLKYLKIFGSVAYVHNKNRKTKFDDKSLKAILVGYESNGYKLWIEEKEKFITARDVIFDEFKVTETRPVNTVNEENCNKNENSDCGISETPVCETGGERKSEELKSDGGPGEMVVDKENANTCENVKTANNDAVENSINEHILSSNKRKNDFEIRKSKRIKELPKISYKEDDSIDNYLMSAQMFTEDIPKNFDEIKTRYDRTSWEKAIKEELDAHVSNKTWSIVDKPHNKNIIDCRWVFTIKQNELGIPIKHKARLVARGFTQEYLVDYDETFAPVARVSSFRFLLAMSAQFDLLVHHMDVKTAFLNGVLKEEIYMTIPQGVNCSGEKVCKLNKAIYGLKQAARCWYECFEQALKEMGFINSSVDRCIYVLNKGHIYKNIYALLYVDDLIIVTKDANSLRNFKRYLMSRFKMTDLMNVSFFIGIRVERSNKTISLSQSSYIQSVLKKFNMENCKPVNNPLSSSINYEELNADDKYDAPCRQLIGCLMYIMICTRPDISTAVNILSRYSNKSNIVLWQSLKRILRYLKGSTDLKLQYKQNLNYDNEIEGYADSDWGGSLNDRRSTTGFIFKMFENCSICWSTKKQSSVAASSTEAEYMALFEAVREALWLKSLAKSVHIKIEEPIKIYEDNQGCISIATSTSCHKRSKHIDIKFHFSREQVENKVISIIYIPTEKQLADILTKPLPTARYLDLRNQLGLIDNKLNKLHLNADDE